MLHVRTSVKMCTPSACVAQLAQLLPPARARNPHASLPTLFAGLASVFIPLQQTDTDHGTAGSRVSLCRNRLLAEELPGHGPYVTSVRSLGSLVWSPGAWDRSERPYLFSTVSRSLRALAKGLSPGGVLDVRERIHALESWSCATRLSLELSRLHWNYLGFAGTNQALIALARG